MRKTGLLYIYAEKIVSVSIGKGNGVSAANEPA
jgi:hypothetical protein